MANKKVTSLIAKKAKIEGNIVTATEKLTALNTELETVNASLDAEKALLLAELASFDEVVAVEEPVVVDEVTEEETF